MDTPCPFTRTLLSFNGTPIDQTRCLLRFVRRLGNVNDSPAVLPPTLASLLLSVRSLTVSKTALRAELAARGIAEGSIGGSPDERVSRANNDDPAARSVPASAICALPAMTCSFPPVPRSSCLGRSPSIAGATPGGNSARPTASSRARGHRRGCSVALNSTASQPRTH